jgi:DNA-binding CsgD family transcriptional regulator/tetratricopeptide (TPR) repeat protein
VLDQLRRGRFRQASELAADLLWSGSDEDRGTALIAYGYAAWHQGRVADALSLLRAGAAHPSRTRAESAGLRAHLALAALLVALGEFSPAAGLIANVDGRPPDRHPLWAAGSPAVAARHHLATGRLNDAAGCALRALEVAERAALREFISTAESVLASVALHRGDMRGAQDHMHRSEAEPPSLEGSVGAASYRLTAAWLVDARDGPAQAFEAIGPLCDDPLVQRPLFVGDPTAPAFLVRTALAVGDHHRAAAVVAGADLIARENDGFPTIIAAELQARGLLEEDPSLLRQAVDAHRHPWARASAMEDLATVTALTDRVAARVAWQHALSAYEGAGAKRDVDRVDRRLRAHGTRANGRRRPRAVEGWGSLTDGELNIAALVAQGLTNQMVAGRLCVSRHTVDFHLRSVYRKMNIHSRVQLASVFSDRPRWR